MYETTARSESQQRHMNEHPPHSIISRNRHKCLLLSKIKTIEDTQNTTYLELLINNQSFIPSQRLFESAKHPNDIMKSLQFKTDSISVTHQQLTKAQSLQNYHKKAIEVCKNDKMKRAMKEQAIFDECKGQEVNIRYEQYVQQKSMKQKKDTMASYRFHSIKITQKPDNLKKYKEVHLKIKTQQQDAKSICSRSPTSQSQENTSQLETIQRQFDIFDFVTPIAQAKCCRMSKALEIRTLSFVILRQFPQDQPQKYQKWLKMFRITQKIIPNRLLPLKEVHISKKQSISRKLLVFQPFLQNLSDFIRKLGPPRLCAQYFGHFYQQLECYLYLLNINGIRVKQPLQLKDFVEERGEWRLRCMCKLQAVN